MSRRGIEVHAWARIDSDTRIEWTIDPEEVVLTLGGRDGALELLVGPEDLGHPMRTATEAQAAQAGQ